MVTPKELTELAEVCIKFGIQHMKTPELEIMINPSLQQGQQLALKQMSKAELEELMYAST